MSRCWCVTSVCSGIPSGPTGSWHRTSRSELTLNASKLRSGLNRNYLTISQVWTNLAVTDVIDQFDLPFHKHAKCRGSDIYLWPFLSDALANLVGQQNARFGIIKIFNALQEASANKHLLYVRSAHNISNIIMSCYICLCC